MQFPRKRVSDVFRKVDIGPVYLTKDGFRRLENKLIRLKKALPQYIVEAERAAAFGDRSDNAEYKEAKAILRRTHWQILNIENQIKRVALIESGPNTSGKIRLGSCVILELQGGTKKSFCIVGPHETNPEKGYISHLSPIGAALLDHKKGDTVIIKTVKGNKEYKVIEIN